MSDSGKAVFLSCASEDAEAVARLAEALRAVGVEVWFDRNELVGGDAWDAKIRKQIAECALFVPVISAATQARREGYFRIEWRLAAQRTHMMSESVAFLLPVVIDTTRDAEADVPVEFKAVQWTRLCPEPPAYGGGPGDAGSRGQALEEDVIAAFCTRVRRLLPGLGAAPVSSQPSGRVGREPAWSEMPRNPSIPDYELIRQIGLGGYGEVWLARGLTGAYCAVKIVRRSRFSDAEPFEREFRGLKESVGALIGQGRGLALLHVGRDEAAGFFYYVMELADDAERGRAIDPGSYVPLTLKELRRRRGRLPADEIRKLGEELAAELAALHARGLVHRDIKPSNIIVVNGAAKLADIGLVASANEAMSFVGTTGFVPPEGPGMPAADVFALGKVLYELATGFDRKDYPKLPTTFTGPTEQAELFELNEIVLRACEAKVDSRYRDGAELAADFAALRHGRSLRDRRGGAQRWWRWAAAVIVTAGGLVAWSWRPDGKAAPDPEPPPEVAAMPADNSIAVLPFANLSGDKAQDYFSDGITQEILGALRRERDLWVPGDTSCFAFKGRSLTAAELGKALNVTRLVEGSVRREGNRVRITVTLTRASDGFSEELGTFTEESGNIFALQEKLARTVVAKLTRREPTNGFAVGTQNPEAYELYLRGRSLQVSGLTPVAGIDLVKTFERVVALDPNYALAWARLAQAYARMRSGGRDTGAKNAADARNAAAAALRLAPDLAEAHLAMARIHYTYDADLEATERELDIADRLGPNDAEVLALRAAVKHARGERGEDLIRLIARSAERDPQNSDTLVRLGVMLSQIGQFAEAHRLLERARAIADIGIHRRPQARNWVKWTGDAAAAGKFLDDTPEGSFDAVLLGLERAELRAMLGDFAGAIADYERLRSLEAARGNVAVPDGRFDELVAPLEARLGQAARAKERWHKALAAVQAAAEKASDPSKFAGRLAFAHARLGEKDAARTWMTKLEPPMRNRSGWQLNYAELLALLGDKEAAIAELRALHDGGHFFGYLLRLELEWETLRGEPKFRQLMKEAEARADAQPRPRAGLVSPPAKKPAALAPTTATDSGSAVARGDQVPPPAGQPVAADKSLVVLPLENLSPDPANAFFTDGLHAEIIATLARLPDLKVTSRATAQVFKGVATPLAEIGRKLGVANILTGSVRREAQNVRVQLELRRAGDEAVLWQKTFSRELQPGFALQDEIGAEVARILQARADAGWYAGAKFMTKNPAAYDLFLKARELPFLRGPSPATFEEQRRLAEEALQLDPEFMSAAALLSSACSYAYTAEADTAKRREHAARAKWWAERAAELVPGGAGDGALAVYYGMVERDPARALAFAENEMRALPNDANGHNRVGANVAEFGRLEEALAAYERALALDPLNVRVLHNRIYPLAHLRRIPEFEAAVARSLELGGKNVSPRAIADYRYRLTGKLPESAGADDRALSVSPPMLWYARRFDELPAAADAALAGAQPIPPEGRFELLRLKGGAYRKLGRAEQLAATAREMLALAESQLPSGGGDRSGSDRMRMWALAYANEPAAAVAVGRRYVEAATGPGRVLERWEREHELARLYAWFGRKKECAEILTKLIRLPTLVTVPYLALAPDWDDVRDDPEIRAIFVDPRNRQPL